MLLPIPPTVYNTESSPFASVRQAGKMTFSPHLLIKKWGIQNRDGFTKKTNKLDTRRTTKEDCQSFLFIRRDLVHTQTYVFAYFCFGYLKLATETLSHVDILALNNAINEIYTARDLESFYRAAFSSIHGMVPYELCSYNDVRLHPARILSLTMSSQEQHNLASKFLPVLNAHVQEHPLIPHFFSGEVVKTSDYASISQFKATGIYNEYYRHLDTETQICFSFAISQEKLALFALSRNGGMDFSERDRLILTLLKPHLIGSLKNVRELGSIRLERDLLQRGVEAERQGVVLCQPEGLIVCISAFAKEMLHKYFAVPVGEGTTLPETLLNWFATEVLSSVNNGGAGGFPMRVEREVLTVTKHDRCLRIKLLNDCTTGDYILFMNESDPSAPLKQLQGYGLTNRESEVLRWLNKGKTSGEIAIILGMSKRTVEKHLEHIFTKLGVETRGAAAAILRHD